MREASQVRTTEAEKPRALDPVAAGASGFRLKACLELMGLRPSVIRGNGSEIIALSKASVGVTKFHFQGLDSSLESMEVMEAAKTLAQSSGAIVIVSGAVDIITDGHQVVGARNGVPMIQKITATGRDVTALMLHLLLSIQAAASALSIFGIAGEMGMDMANGPASLYIFCIRQ
uniref:hydroxyethylthiazole kinase n=1 Tax=Salix viminalis TaxID=40686 RepID=A0A6N2M5P8_SALVM